MAKIVFPTSKSVGSKHTHSDGKVFEWDGKRWKRQAEAVAVDPVSAVLAADGTGSGLDADTVDGQHASEFAASSHTHDYAATSHTHSGMATETWVNAQLSSLSASADEFITATSDPANPTTGQVYFNTTDKSLRIWNGNAWGKQLYVADGLTSSTAADSAWDLKQSGQATADGIYWIKGDNGVPFQAYCNMTLAGGGWVGIMNIDTNNGVNHHWSDTSWWQGANTTGLASNFLSDHHKNAGFVNFSNFTEIMIVTHQEGTYKAHGTWTLLPAYNTYSMYNLLNIADSSVGTKITGNRTAQGGDTGFTNNPNRNGNASWRCEFTDSATGYELRVNWYGAGGYYSKYSTSGDTHNYVRLTTGLGDYYGPSGDGGYQHSYSGLGGHHERPAGSYVLNYDFAAYTEYCDTVNFFSSNAGNPCGGSSINIDCAIYVR